MVKSSRHLAGLDMLRGVAALGVMLFHISGVGFQQRFGLPTVSGFAFGYAGLDLFFVLSGFIIFTVHADDIGSPACLPAYGWKRLTRIYPAYWLVCLLYLGVLLATRSAIDWHRLVHAWFLFPDVEPILPVAWTLSHELLFYAVFGLLIQAPTSGKLVAVAWFVGSVLCLGASNPLWSFLFNIRHLEFLIGAAAAFAIRRDMVVQPMMTASAGLALFVFTAVLDMHQATLSGTGFILGYGVASGMVIAGMAQAEMAGRLRIPALPRLLGAASYSIYLTHLLAFSLLARLLLVLHLPVLLPSWLLLALLTTLLCGIGVGFHLALEKPLLGLCRRAGSAWRVTAKGAVTA